MVKLILTPEGDLLLKMTCQDPRREGESKIDKIFAVNARIFLEKAFLWSKIVKFRGDFLMN